MVVKATKPSNSGSTITLADGRILGFCEYISPLDLPKKDKLPVILFFPGIPGSRLFSHPEVTNPPYSGNIGVRLFVLDRPGLGISSEKPGRTILDWADDVQEFVKALHIPRFSVLGYSAGGPYALA
ncbi:hypothetical protein HK096_010885, partial [Nowakowskiella sp. JEL0078]